MNTGENLHYVPGNLMIILSISRICQFFWYLLLSIPDLIVVFVKKFFPGKGKNVAGKNVLITGAANGLGKALAFEFARKGSRIICVDVNKEANEKTVSEINKMTKDPTTAKSYICDVSDTEAIKKLADEVHRDYKIVDILINNAGLIYGKRFLEEDEEMVKKVVNVNQMSSYWMVRSFLPKMKERNEGHLVFINSIACLTPLGDAAIYTITKFALLVMQFNLASEDTSSNSLPTPSLGFARGMVKYVACFKEVKVSEHLKRIYSAIPNGLTSTLADDFNRDPSCSNIKISSVHPFFMATEGLKAQPLASRIVMLKVDEAAAKIVCGIRREYYNFTVPGYETGFWILSLSRIIPLKVYNKLVKAVYNQVLLPEKSK